MPDPIITLTTDFGEDSPYVAAMKGVILGMNPAARLVDLSHLIPPQDVQYGAFFLAETIPFFPPQTLHVVVVDPGVGTDRAMLYLRLEEHQLLAPDNGVASLLAGRRTPREIRRLADARYWRHEVSATFHGRDVLAPVAAHLSLGLDPGLLGPHTDSWQQLPLPAPAPEPGGWRGEALFVDHFGNVLTNLPAAELPAHPFRVRISPTGTSPGQEYPVRAVRAYGEAAPGELVALVSSGGWWEFAVVNGNAARRLGAGPGSVLHVS